MTSQFQDRRKNAIETNKQIIMAVNFPFGERHKLIDLKSSMNPKQDKSKEIHTHKHDNNTSENTEENPHDRDQIQSSQM